MAEKDDILNWIRENLPKDSPYQSALYMGLITSGFMDWNDLTTEEKIAMGKRVVQIITQKDASKLVGILNRKGYGVTNIPAQGSRGRVNVIYSIIERSDLDRVIHWVERVNPGAFYSVQNILSVKEGIFPNKRGIFRRMFPQYPRFYRKISLIKKFRILRKSK